jgi:hypothetical protein
MISEIAQMPAHGASVAVRRCFQFLALSQESASSVLRAGPASSFERDGQVGEARIRECALAGEVIYQIGELSPGHHREHQIRSPPLAWKRLPATCQAQISRKSRRRGPDELPRPVAQRDGG